MRKSMVLALATVLLLAAVPASAGEAVQGIRAELVQILGFGEARALKLLAALPQEKLSWRPAEGVRSASELFMHVALSPFFIGTMVGVERPKGLRKLEKTVADKAEIAEHLKRGFAHARKAILSVSEGDLDKTKKAPWGMEHSMRFYLLILPQHVGVHLAQLGLYARLNGIEPPWVSEERKRAAERKAAAEKKAAEAKTEEKK
jgi:uncharacterized damage-inducible protein DinB